jgi:hypothetical protein
LVVVCKQVIKGHLSYDYWFMLPKKFHLNCILKKIFPKLFGLHKWEIPLQNGIKGNLLCFEQRRSPIDYASFFLQIFQLPKTLSIFVETLKKQSGSF